MSEVSKKWNEKFRLADASKEEFLNLPICKKVKYIYENYGFMSSEKREKIIEFLQTTDDKRILKYKSDLTLNVPYRLQVPFYDEIDWLKTRLSALCPCLHCVEVNDKIEKK